MRRVIITSAVAVVAAVAVGIPSAAGAPTLDAAGPMEAQDRRFQPLCQTPESLDCIESIEYLVDGQWQTAQVDPTWEGEDDFVFDTPLLSHEGGRTQVRAALLIRDDITGPEYPAYYFQLQSHPQDEVLWDPPINRCEGGDPEKPTGSDPCARAPWLADAEYRFTFRSRDFEPVFAQSTIVGMVPAVTQIPGGLRVSVTGRPGASQWVLDYETAQRDDRFDAVTREWYGFITDVRSNGGTLRECTGLGFAAAYSNGNGGSIPQWDPRTGSLAFNVDGFHYRPDGPVYRGEAEVFVPGELARCMWKVDPRQASRMEIEVFTENGEEAVGTKSVAYDAEADLVRLIATNFTYSQKGIVARPTPLAVVPGKPVCDATGTTCVTIDKKRKTAKVTLTKVSGTSSIVAVALRGARENGRSEKRAAVKKGKASLTLKLAGKKSKNQVWVLRTPSTFITSFQVG